MCKSLGFGRKKEIKVVALNASETPVGIMYSSGNRYFRNMNMNSKQKKGKADWKYVKSYLV